MIIFLIGLMGAGKTTLGKTLANKLKYKFYDLDDEIETAEKQSIAHFFHQYGEAEFRKVERHHLEKLVEQLSKKNAIIACGGGTPCHLNTIEYLNKNGITIYLEVPIEELVNRLSNKEKDRPLLINSGLHSILTTLFENRYPFYNQAQFTLSGNNLTVKDILSKITIIK